MLLLRIFIGLLFIAILAGAEDAGKNSLSVQITEVNWAGSPLSTADEWLEIAAGTQSTGKVDPISLEGWTLRTVKNEAEEIMLTLGDNIQLSSGSVIVIANYDAEHSCLLEEPTYVTTAVSLPNSKLLLRLYNVDGELVDEVDDGVGAPYAGSNATPKASMNKISFLPYSRAESNWITEDEKIGIDADCAMTGTPGVYFGTHDDHEDEDMLAWPTQVAGLQAFAHNGSFIARWSVPKDIHTSFVQELAIASTEDEVLERHVLPATQNELLVGSFSGSAASVMHRWLHENGTHSSGSTIHVQPLHKTIINEVLPNPKGSDDVEWIELFNPYSQALDLSDFSLVRGASRYSFLEGSGSLLQPGAHKKLEKRETGITLPNRGAEVQLYLGSLLVDTLRYPEVPEGISYGRVDGLPTPLCSPIPEMENRVEPLKLFVEGVPDRLEGVKSININIGALNGSLEGAQCTADFGDGYVYQGCNPPSHAINAEKEMAIDITVKDYCGTTVIHTIRRTPGQVVSAQKKKGDESHQCVPTTFSGVTISEFMPAPAVASDEWIELYNTSDTALNLCGWQVDDGVDGSSPYNLESYTLYPGVYLLLSRRETGIALNNDNDSVRLISPVAEGGTGVFMSIPYYKAPKDVSYARNEKGGMVQTPFATPGADNRFREPVQVQETVVIQRALPNPKGVDTYDETVTLFNTSMAPQWLNGWTLQTLSGASMKLDGFVIPRKSEQKISLYKKGLSLKNTDGSLLLYDNNYQLRSALYWKKAEEGKNIEQTTLHTQYTPEKIHFLEHGTIGFYQIVDESAYRPVKKLLTGSLIGSALDDYFYKSNIKNRIKALIKGKKIELKSSSNSGSFILFADGRDILKDLLLEGALYLGGELHHSILHSYTLYQKEAETLQVGIWQNEEDRVQIAQVIAVQKERRKLEEEGLKITVSMPSGLMESGTVLTARSNVPAALYVAYGTGRFLPFAGTLSVHKDQQVRIRADYTDPLTQAVSSSVVTQYYSVLKEEYEPCIAISEVYASPQAEEEEWIELQSNCAEQVSLLGWILDDETGKGSKPFTIGTGYVLLPGDFAVLKGDALKIVLNNGGDAVQLFTPRKNLSSSVRYPSVKKGYSYAYMDDAFCLTATPTEKVENICTLPVHKSSRSVATAKKMIIGLAEKYVYVFFGQEGEENAEFTINDFSLYEGLNINLKNKYMLPIYIVFTFFLALILALFLYFLKHKNML